MVKAALGGLGLEDDILYGGVVIALLIEQLPRCRDDAALGIASGFTGHGGHLLSFFGGSAAAAAR